MLCKYETRCVWRCMTPSILDNMVNTVPYHCSLLLDILLNWLLCKFRNVWVHLVWKVPVGAEFFYIASGWVGAPPTLQRVFGPTCYLYYGLLGHTHTHGFRLPAGIIWLCRYGKWRMFLIPPARIISIMKISSWGHEYHWCMLSCIFISWFFRS